NVEADAHADPHRVGCNVFDPANQPKAFVAIDQRDVVGGALARMSDGRRIDGAEPGADPPFETVAAGERADDAGVEDGLLRLRAPLIGQLALFEVRLIDSER